MAKLAPAAKAKLLCNVLKRMVISHYRFDVAGDLGVASMTSPSRFGFGLAAEPEDALAHAAMREG